MSTAVRILETFKLDTSGVLTSIINIGCPDKTFSVASLFGHQVIPFF